jgi:hypothetical protein
MAAIPDRTMMVAKTEATASDVSIMSILGYYHKKPLGISQGFFMVRSW